MFFAETPKKETATRASCTQEEAAKREGAERILVPLPSMVFAFGRGRDLSKKPAKINGATLLFWREWTRLIPIMSPDGVRRFASMVSASNTGLKSVKDRC
jgi:hypothetical protein